MTIAYLKKKSWKNLKAISKNCSIMVMITDQFNSVYILEWEIIALMTMIIMMATGKIIMKTIVITEKREKRERKKERKTMISWLIFLF